MKKLNKLTSSYVRDKKGIVAPFFGLMVLPMLAITGAAIDIGQAITAERSCRAQSTLRRWRSVQLRLMKTPTMSSRHSSPPG